MDGSPPGSAIPGILQARILEWVAISFSSAWKWKVKVKSLSRVRLLATTWTAAHQAPPSMGFARQEYWSGLPSSSPENRTITNQINNQTKSTDQHVIYVGVCVYMCVCTYIYMSIYIYLNNILQPRRTYFRNSIINTIKILLKSLIFSIGWSSSSKMSCIW